MATIDDLEAAERAFRQLLTDGDLPQPDEVEYGQSSVFARWYDAKLTVEIDVTERPQP